MIRTIIITLLFFGSARAQTIAITNARIMTMGAAGEFNPGAVLIEDGKIASVGATVSIPDGARIIDAEGKMVTPGIVVTATSLGLVEIRNGVDGDDDRACKPPCPGAAFDVQYGLNPDSVLIPAARLGGVTRAIATPAYGSGDGASLFSGQAAAISLSQDGKILTQAKVAQVLELGEAGAGRAGGSRGAAILSIRAALDAARRGGAPTSSSNGLSGEEVAALIPVAQGRMPLIVAVHRAADILQVLALGEEYGLRLVLLGAEEGWRVADDIARAGASVILDPTHNRPNAFETLGSTLDNARILYAAGVLIAIEGNGPHRAREARYNAGNAVANGLPWEAALEAVTANPARIFGLENLFGAIEPGLEADVVIWDGDPLEPLTTPVAVFIRGVEQSLSSRGTKLRDRYMNLGADYPPAYN